MKLDDPTLDSADPAARDAWLLEAIRLQIDHLRASVPFWQERLAIASVDEHRLESLADLAAIPIFTKAELRATPPELLLPSDTRSQLKIFRWTSGTSGRPTVNFWTETDWAALVAATARMIGRQAPMQAPAVFNAYGQAHSLSAGAVPMPIVRLSETPIIRRYDLTMSRTTLRAKGQLTLPEDIRSAAHLEEGDLLEAEITPDGILLRPQKLIDATQAWFWNPTWQAGEREADADRAAGRVETFESGDAFLAALTTEAKPVRVRRNR